LNNLQDKKALTHTKHNTLTTQEQNPPTLDAAGIKQNTTQHNTKKTRVDATKLQNRYPEVLDILFLNKNQQQPIQ
jgi:hypothetical protein